MIDRWTTAWALTLLWGSTCELASAQSGNLIYIEDFEVDEGNFRWVEQADLGGSVSPEATLPWVWGSPNGSDIDAAGQGLQCWYTDGTSLPTQPGKSTLQSPPIDLTQLALDPVLQFRHAFELATDTDYRVEVSIAGGPFERLGATPAPGALNWYDSSETSSWSNNSKEIGSTSSWWITSRHRLEGAAGHTVRIRWTGSWSDDNWFSFQEGWALDDVRIEAQSTDVALLDVQIPEPRHGLGFEDLGFTAKNIGVTHVASLNVQLEVNGPIAGTLTASVPVDLAPDETDSFNFPGLWDFGVEGNYSVKVTLAAPNDIMEDNDSIEEQTSHLVSIDQFPYEVSFESGPGPFAATGHNSSWEWGSPATPYIGTAASGLSAWTTNLDGDFNKGERSYLWTPEFDLTEAEGEFWLEFNHIFQLFGNCIGKVEFSIDDGPFQVLGTHFGPGSLNWYNSSDVPPDGGWNSTLGTPGVWNLTRHLLPGAAGHRVRLRFLFDGTGKPPYHQIWTFGAPSGSGIGIDDFAVRSIDFESGQASVPGVSVLTVGSGFETPYFFPSTNVHGFPPSYGMPGPYYGKVFLNGIHLSVQGQPNQVFALFTGDLAPASLALPGVGQIDLVDFELMGFGGLSGGLNPFFVTDSDGLFELTLSSFIYGSAPLAFQAVTIDFDGSARLTNAVEVTFYPF